MKTKSIFTVPSWIESNGKADFISFFEVMALLDIENRWVRMSAADQRKLFGVCLFGKKQFKVSSSGVVTVGWSCCFGHDFEEVVVDRESLKTAIENKTKLYV